MLQTPEKDARISRARNEAGQEQLPQSETPRPLLDLRADLFPDARLLDPRRTMTGDVKPERVVAECPGHAGDDGDPRVWGMRVRPQTRRINTGHEESHVVLQHGAEKHHVREIGRAVFDEEYFRIHAEGGE